MIYVLVQQKIIENRILVRYLSFKLCFSLDGNQFPNVNIGYF